MKLGLAVSSLIGAVALVAGGYTFLSNTVPYVSVREALDRQGESVHVVGKIDKASVQTKVSQGVLEFDLIDPAGERLHVVFSGMKPANFDSAPTISVAGRTNGKAFEADRILVKCPSKYESDTKA